MEVLPAGSVPESTARPSALDGAVARPAPAAPPSATLPQDPQPMQDVREGRSTTASTGAGELLELTRTVDRVIDQSYANPAEARERLRSLTPGEATTLATDPSVLGPLRPDVPPSPALGAGLRASVQSAAMASPDAQAEFQAQQSSGLGRTGPDNPDGKPGLTPGTAPAPAGAAPSLERQMNQNLGGAVSIGSMSI